MHRVAVWVLSGWFALSVAGSSQPLSLQALGNRSEGIPKAGAECTGGIRYDDGGFEYSFYFSPSDSVGRFVSRFQLPANVSRVNAVCLCLARNGASAPDAFTGTVEIWSVSNFQGVLGPPVALLASFPAAFTGVPSYEQGCAFYRVEIPPGFIVEGAATAFIGLKWLPASGAADLMIGGDRDGDDEVSPAYGQYNGGEWRRITRDAPAALLGIRAEASDVTPPDSPWLTTSALPGFRFKIRITSGAQQIAGVQEKDCVPETLCVSGAVRGRSEVFVRIIGPRPNGFLWPNLVKFTTSQVEVWIEQLSTGRLRYYKLPAQGPADTSLPGLVDREAFEP